VNRDEINLTALESPLKLTRGNTYGPKFRQKRPSGAVVTYTGGDLVLDFRLERRKSSQDLTPPIVRWSIGNEGLVYVAATPDVLEGWQMVITPAQWNLLTGSRYVYGLEHRFPAGVREILSGGVQIVGDAVYG